ncbi:hypothetical protein ACSHWF_09345 [Aerococcus urinaeequi]|uniref:hypothetical protein n=1 Tax=Aerococcus urinaeequi TaxID=51665 RepID=UPI003EDB188B
MTTANIQVGDGKSYSGLSEYHYELDKQDSKFLNQADYDFPIHEHVVLKPQAYSDLQAKQGAMIASRDEARLKQRKKDTYGSLDGYFKKINSNKKLKHAVSNNYPLLFSVSNLDEYESMQKIVETPPFSMSENDFRKIHTKALKSAVESFDELGIPQLSIDEYYVHANEQGVPHIHSRVLVDAVSVRKGRELPQGNLGTILTKHYGIKSQKTAFSKFREQTDTHIINHLKDELEKAFQDKGVDLSSADIPGEDKEKIQEYTTLTRTSGVIYDTQQAYINAEKEHALENLKNELDFKEREISDREYEVHGKEIETESSFNFALEKSREIYEQATLEKADVEKKERDLERKTNHLDTQIIAINNAFHKRKKEEEERLENAEIALKAREVALKEKEQKVKLQEEKLALKNDSVQTEKITQNLDMMDTMEQILSVSDDEGSDIFIDLARENELIIPENSTETALFTPIPYYSYHSGEPMNRDRDWSTKVLKDDSLKDKFFRRLENFKDAAVEKVKELAEKVKQKRLDFQQEKNSHFLALEKIIQNEVYVGVDTLISQHLERDVAKVEEVKVETTQKVQNKLDLTDDDREILIALLQSEGQSGSRSAKPTTEKTKGHDGLSF